MYFSIIKFTILGFLCIPPFHPIEGTLFSNIRFGYENGVATFKISDHSDAESFKLVFTIDQPSLEFHKYENCSTKPDQHCIQFPQDRIELIKTSDRCVNVNASTLAERVTSVKIHLGNVHLYGGAEHAEIKWPMEKLYYEEHPYVTTTYYYQAIVEPYWLTSNGYYIYVDDSVPLFVSLEANTRILSLVSRKELPYVKSNLINSLDFVICKFQNPRVAQLHAVNTILGKPTDIPDVYRVKHPIWSTWVKFKNSIDERLALMYAKEISDRGYRGQIEIDDNWEKCYGSLEPDTDKFSHLKMTVKGIKKFGFKVTIWVHPFVNLNCEPAYSMGKSSGYFVKNLHNDTYMKWWRGKGAVIDFTNPKASRWFRKRLETLKHVYDVDSFKFDGGESDYSPKPAMYYKMAEDHPHTVVKSYVKMISSLGSNVHTRVAKGTQKYPIFVTMMDRESSWGNALGLYSMLPQVFQMNLLGYSFVLPDMIGGNAYNKMGTEELFIRWVQVNTFLPSMQFSILPWDISENCAEITRKFVDLHYNYSDTIIKLMKKNVQTGAPVNPPIWWIAPLDEEALKCDNEFLLGEDILIAPVLLEGTSKRDIYLPAGYWRDENHPDATYIEGPTWIYDYEAPLDVLPYFTRVNSFNVETLVYLQADGYRNNWVLFIVTISVMIFVCAIFQIVTRCLKVRKRVLTWYSKLKWISCRLRK